MSSLASMLESLALIQLPLQPTGQSSINPRPHQIRMARHASEHVLEPHVRPMLRHDCQQPTHPGEPCDSQRPQRVPIHDLQIIQQEFFQTLPTTSYGRRRWNAHLLQLPQSGHLLTPSRIVVPHTLSRGPSQMFRAAVHDQLDGTVPSKPAKGCPAPHPQTRFCFPL